MLEFLLQLDRELFLFLNGLHMSWLDPVMFFLSNKYGWIPLYAFLMYISVKKFGWRTIFMLLFIVLMITITDQATGFMKSFFQRYRPSRDENLEGLVHIVNNYRGGRYGFVSAHAANSFALAVFIVHIFGKKLPYLVPLMFTYAFVNTYTRIYLGVHYPGDVIAGALTGILVALIIIGIWEKAYPRIFPVHEKL
jgi:undecaprenyl-diphosphatase